MFGLVCWVFFGAVVGGVAKAILPGRVPGGWLPAIGLGVLASVVGGLFSGGHPAGLVLSIIVAVLLVYSWEMIGGSNGQ